MKVILSVINAKTDLRGESHLSIFQLTVSCHHNGKLIDKSRRCGFTEVYEWLGPLLINRKCGVICVLDLVFLMVWENEGY